MIEYVLYFLILAEFFVFLITRTFRRKFQWIITPTDENPHIDKNALKRFIKHGFDKELGWCRHPNTWHNEMGIDGKTTYHIGSDGARANPGHEKARKKISTYGDSFCFCRQNNDNDTWQWYLSEMTGSNVMNFGVGNYGIDQALLRLKREYQKNKTKTVIICVVPSTIVRILCVWKHWNEYGNVFGFKPRFRRFGDSLVLIDNFIKYEKSFYNLEHYIPLLKKHDYFYYTKFRKEMIRFPYIYHFWKNPRRNVPLFWYVATGQREKALMKIMEINLKLRVNLYKKVMPPVLFERIIDGFVRYAKEQKFEPILMILPQKDDVAYIGETGDYYYKLFLDVVGKKLKVIDITEYLMRENLDDLYSDDNQYGGHPNRFGNQKVAKWVYDEIRFR